MVSAKEGIAIAQISVYSPLFLLTVIILFRHGFKRQFGWIYLAIFCLVRIAGATFKIESISHPTNETDAKWAVILQFVGLSPLLLASMGLLKRVTDLVSRRTPSDPGAVTNIVMSRGGVVSKIISRTATATSRRSRVIQLAQLPIMIALVLCIIGGTERGSADQSDASKGLTYTKIGVVIFLVAYLLLAALVALTLKDVGNAPQGDKHLYWTIVAACPLLAVRLLWSMLAVFSNDNAFSISDSNPWINFGMVMIEEFVIACMYTVAGLTVGK